MDIIYENLKIIFGSISGVSILILFLISKWKKPRVFISYNNEMNKYVDTMASILKIHNIDCRFIPYIANDHNKIIQLVGKEISKADIIIVVTGNRNAVNFVDAEILTALTLKKSVFAIKTTDDQHFPNTALKNIITFDFEEAYKNSFEKIAKFFKLITLHITFVMLLIFWGIVLVIFFLLINYLSSLIMEASPKITFLDQVLTFLGTSSALILFLAVMLKKEVRKMNDPGYEDGSSIVVAMAIISGLLRFKIERDTDQIEQTLRNPEDFISKY